MLLSSINLELVFIVQVGLVAMLVPIKVAQAAPLDAKISI